MAKSDGSVKPANTNVESFEDSEPATEIETAPKLDPDPTVKSTRLEMEALEVDNAAMDPAFEESAPMMSAAIADPPNIKKNTTAPRTFIQKRSQSRMSVMAPAEVETELPSSQTKLNVFYATDRKSRYGVSTDDWINVHLSALIALGVYVVSFAGVFVTRKKGLCGLLAFSSLIIFLVLGQSASVTWQKHQRLAENGDVSYISEIRPLSSDGLLDYGTCEVTIPPDHKIGHLDSPSLFKLEFREDPEKHVVLHRVIRTEKTRFYDQLNDAIDQSKRDQALVFIHGYNVSFENAVKRTAQIVHDLKFDGPPICYSWTSHGALANYTRDLANADATVVALQSFLEETVRKTGNSTIHLVAHSMGNRALLQALDRIAVGSSRGDRKMFGQLVMAAPDVSVNDFRTRFVPSAQSLAKNITLYASSRDRALLASTEIHGHDRAGLAGDNLVVIDGMDTIDVSEIDTSLIGHSYYGDHPELIRDLRALVELSQPAAQRSWLMPVAHAERFRYFRFAEQRANRSNEIRARRR